MLFISISVFKKKEVLILIINELGIGELDVSEIDVGKQRLEPSEIVKN